MCIVPHQVHQAKHVQRNKNMVQSRLYQFSWNTAENGSVSVIERSKIKALASRSRGAAWVCELSGGACETNSITSQILKFLRHVEKVPTFNYQDFIKNEQVASNGTLELTEFRGKKVAQPLPPPPSRNKRLEKFF